MSTVTDRPAASRQATSRQAASRPAIGLWSASRPEGQNEETAGQGTSPQSTSRQSTVRQSAAEADGLAIASFLLGLPGLLLFNIVLGPIAITLAILALVRGTSRRGRALLGLTLGIASLVILAVTIVTSHGVLIDIGS
ncbi:DUF4190 domain-containing protein [Kitasatospora sp. NPDC058444]|uniref:DUF4190 domain-containing protein n=1 Tax=Kitasatospora sp. NPDC058444 TaxID=3346504 RepID=UPI00365B4869